LQPQQVFAAILKPIAGVALAQFCITRLASLRSEYWLLKTAAAQTDFQRAQLQFALTTHRQVGKLVWGFCHDVPFEVIAPFSHSRSRSPLTKERDCQMFFDLGFKKRSRYRLMLASLFAQVKTTILGCVSSVDQEANQAVWNYIRRHNRSANRANYR
jgi:hypothetical protein